MVPRTVLTRSDPILVNVVRWLILLREQGLILLGQKQFLVLLRETRNASYGSACNPQQDLKDKIVIDSGCSRHMTGNRSYLTDYEEIDGGFVAFGGTKACNDAGKARMETVPGKDYILLPMSGGEKKDADDQGNEDSEVPSTEEPRVYQQKDDNVSSTNNVNTASNTINTVSPTVNADGIEVM
ncbi:hypothetical protein Tco_1438109 [Tanacetum coccineum]